MKNTRTMILALIAGAGVALLLSQTVAQPAAAPAPAAAPTLVAVCDVAAVFANSEKAQDLKRRENANTKGLAETEKQKAAEIRDKQNSLLEDVAPDTTDYNTRLGEIQQMIVAMKAWGEMADWQSKQWKYKQTLKLYRKIMDLIAEVAKERGIDIVLHRRKRAAGGGDLRQLLSQINSRKVIYAGSGCVDLTAEVLKRLDASYKTSVKKAG